MFSPAWNNVYFWFIENGNPMNTRIAPVLLLLLLHFWSFGQPTYFSDQVLRFEDKIYKPNIKTILLTPDQDALGFPALALNSTELLRLSFDDLNGQAEVYHYTFIHCDASWNPSPLNPNEYLEGFLEDEIRDYDFSFNTTRSYTHYSVTFPNEYIRPKRSGNYLVVVYKEKPEEPSFSMRFMMYEPIIDISNLSAKRATMPDSYQTKQEVDFQLSTGKLYIGNPSRDIKVILLQNERWDNAITNLQPRNISGDVLDYDYEEGNLFIAGNEFRRIDIKSLKYNSERIDSIRFRKDGYHVFVKPDMVNTFRDYITDTDINGKQIIHTEDMQVSEIEADYVWVHFNLPFGFPLANGNLYIQGAFTQRRFSPEAMMNYNMEKKKYEAVFLLKQGYYNYQYLFVETGKKPGDPSLMEGSHYETKNQYTLLVYVRQQGDMHDSLLGFAQIPEGTL
jgi:hypothetical protein